MNKRILLIFFGMLLLASCSPSPSVLLAAVAETVQAFTPYPSQTPYPTATPQPTIVVTRVVVRTPVPNRSDSACKPMTSMDYKDANEGYVMLQAYVAMLPSVRQVSYTIPENLYSNSTSHLVHVSYVNDSDGETYSKRYIVYMREFGWSEGDFSIDGQCWVDGPH